VTDQEAVRGDTVSVATSSLRFARKVAVAVIGSTVLALGIALIVLPGPAFVVIPLGLAILATEFLWARRLLRRVRQGATSAYQKMRGN
jgi:tellurite resistance protein TerC